LSTARSQRSAVIQVIAQSHTHLKPVMCVALAQSEPHLPPPRAGRLRQRCEPRPAGDRVPTWAASQTPSRSSWAGARHCSESMVAAFIVSAAAHQLHLRQLVGRHRSLHRAGSILDAARGAGEELLEGGGDGAAQLGLDDGGHPSHLRGASKQIHIPYTHAVTPGSASRSCEDWWATACHADGKGAVGRVVALRR
jgi:hypothetical protein